MQTRRVLCSIRLRRFGCTNRPFFHIVVAPSNTHNVAPYIEQLGVYDPMPNENNEKLVAVNIERFQYWLAQGAHVNTAVSILLGLSGVLPIHPVSYLNGWRNRKKKLEKECKAGENLESEKANQ